MTRRPFARGLALLLLAVGAAGAEAPFLAPGADVVVLTGLPGDVESETAYLGHVGRLLGLLAEPGRRPARLVVLADTPGAVRVPAGVAAEVRPASREAFLGLARELAGSDRPLVVIAWGHGGVQGAAPVFHVRGPRLSPEDFRVLAGAAPRSSWALFFRGSGAFARALRGDGREVLSSEESVAFRSDPIGLPLFLEALEAGAGRPLGPLAERVAHATLRWYERRHLARQEEPTLWVGGAEPRRLIVTTVAAGPAAGGTTTPAASPSPSPELPGVTTRKDLPEAWAAVTRVEPGAYPEADAVVLRSRTRYVLGSSPAVASESDLFVQVLTEEGKRYGDFDVAYSPPFEEVTFLDCEVLRADGTLARLDPEREVHEAGSSPVPEYSRGARKVFSLPGVEPGAVLRVHTRSEWKTFPLPHVFLELPLVEDAPVVESEVEVRVPLESALHWDLRNLPRREPEVAETSYGRVHTWRFSGLDPPPEEPLTHPVRTPSLLLSTFPDWAAFASWYAGLIREADQVTPEIAARARDLTKGARTDREKVAAVYDYVTRLRYVAVELGVNSHRPHAAANVLRNKYGDCKDKANLFNTLLRALGIAADLVLVPRFTQAHDATPGLAFNHAISRVRLGAEVIWADTTDDVCRFGLLPPGDPGRKVLVVDGSRTLTELPRPDPDGHALVLEARVDAASDGATAPATLEVRSTGYADYQLRAAARQVGRAPQPVLALGLRSSAGDFALTSQTHTPVGALAEEFVWRGEGAFHGLVASLPGGGSEAVRMVRAPFWLPREWEEALHRRRSPLFLNQGYPLVLDQRIEVKLPATAARVALPAARGGEGSSAREEEPLRWRVTWSREGGAVVARLEARLASGELSWDETLLFQEQLRSLAGALAVGPTYTRRN